MYSSLPKVNRSSVCISGEIPRSLLEEIQVFIQRNPQWTIDEVVATGVTLLMLLDSANPEAIESSKKQLADIREMDNKGAWYDA